MLSAVGGLARAGAGAGAAAARAASAAASAGARAAGAAARATSQVARNIGTNIKRAVRPAFQTTRPLASAPKGFRSISHNVGAAARGPTSAGGRSAGKGASPFTRGSTQSIRAGENAAQNTAGAMGRAGTKNAGQAGRAGKGAKDAGGAGSKATVASRAEQVYNYGSTAVMAAGAIVPLFKNPLSGLEDLLNPANWQQDMSWLAGLLNPANFKQDFAWLENVLKSLGSDVGAGISDIGKGLSAVERFGEAAWKDTETVGKDAVWGAEELWQNGRYIGIAVALLWIYSYVK